MNRRRAFTLMEILVVVSILALLLMILFPAFSGVKRTVKRVKCLSNLGNLTKALHNYAMVNANRMPPLSSGRPPYGAQTPTDSWKLLNTFLKTQNYEVLQCPSDQGETANSSKTVFEDRGYSYYYVANGSDEWPHKMGICEIVGDPVPYFEYDVGNNPGPLRMDVENGLRNVVSFDQIDGIYQEMRDKAKRYANQSGFWVPDLKKDFSYKNKGPYWKNKVYTTDYWTRPSRKVCFLDWDAKLEGKVGDEDSRPLRGFWHEYSWELNPREPDNVDVALVKVHAAFLDGHSEPITINKFDSIDREHDHY